MDAATTERFVRRFLEGMQYEADRTAPPEGFPKFPPIPGGRYSDPAFLEAERAGPVEAHLAVRLPHRRAAGRRAASCCGPGRARRS